jgi:hypothetical protein
MLSKPRSSQGMVVVVVGLTLGSTGYAHAEQFTFFDIKYTATEQNSNKPVRGHYDLFDGKEVQFTQPANWTSPIDYTKGTVVIELDAIEKPSEELAQIDICFLTPPKGYGCRNTTKYTKPGRYQLVRPMPTGFNNPQMIEWTKKITHVQLVTKDGANNNGGTDLKKFFPHTSRIAMTFVAPGSQYVLPPGWTPAPGADAGVSPADDAGAAPSDAGGATSDAAAPVGDGATSSPGTGGGSGSSATGGTSGAGGSGGSTSTGGTSAGSSSATGGATGGSGGRSGTGGSKTEPTPPPSEPTSSSKAGACSLAPNGSQPNLPGTLVLLASALVGLTLRQRKSRR